MAAPQLELVVDDSAFLAIMGTTATALEGLVEQLAAALSDDASLEAGQRSSRLGEEWPVSGAGPEERTVTAPEWWAGFLARGTQDHGPVKASRLVFSVDDEFVFATFVRGISADPFDERAVERTRARVDEIMNQAIEGAA